MKTQIEELEQWFDKLNTAQMLDNSEFYCDWRECLKNVFTMIALYRQKQETVSELENIIKQQRELIDILVGKYKTDVILKEYEE